MKPRMAWRVMTGLALIIAAWAAALVVVPDLRPPFIRQRLAYIPLAVYGHFIASAVALALGPFQFRADLRATRPSLHRWVGRAYLVSVLIGGLSGLVLGMYAQGGLAARAGFVTLAVLWLSSAIRAYGAIRARNTVNHQRWMTRNYALTFAAVTLRIYLPLAAIAGVPFETAYPAIAWLCWVPNLAVAEWRFQPRKPGAGAISSAALN